MAKKKPAKTSRPIATTSIASKPREACDKELQKQPVILPQNNDSVAPETQTGASATKEKKDFTGATSQSAQSQPELSAEQFEEQLEEASLQIFVDKYASKVRRDANRQRQKLETERRLLRAQSTPINVLRWLPRDLLDQILDQIQAENRFAASLSSDISVASKSMSEDEILARLWTLRQTLLDIGFSQDRMQPTLKHVLEVSHAIQSPLKESIWGLDEALTWLACQCPIEELPEYDSKGKISANPLTDQLQDPYTLAPLLPPPSARINHQTRNHEITKPVIICDSDIEPESLIDEWIKSKVHVLRLQHEKSCSLPILGSGVSDKDDAQPNLELALHEARLYKIENDVLFDSSVAEQEWKPHRLRLEKELGQARKKSQEQEQEGLLSSTGAKKTQDSFDSGQLANDGLVDNDDVDDGFANLNGLFDMLPVSDVDAATGKTITTLNVTGGQTVIIRTFGQWSGISPMRVLEEACRSRDSNVRISYSLLSESTFANRHRATIAWSKPQYTPAGLHSFSEVQVFTRSTEYFFSMSGVATPTQKESEAYVSTFALFYIFSSSPKDEKVFLRLPPVWRELWSELSLVQKDATDKKYREEVKELRTIVRRKQDQEDEDGVILPGAFKGRNLVRQAPVVGNDSTMERHVSVANPDYYRKLWSDKSSSRRYNTMLVS
jgi:ATP-dependent RNA helicase DHX29